jgi:molybdenum cofactor biosynthesis enzyme MoaA
MIQCQIFRSTVNLRTEHCSKNNSTPLSIQDPYVNMYVKLRNDCNAKCKFCEFRGDQQDFNLNKLRFIVREITVNHRFRINKISFTGGEPTIDMNMLSNAVDIVRMIDKKIFIVVNTNGVNLHKMANLKVDSIAMSRHHYLDEKNNEILGFNAPTKEQIKAFPNKSLLHLSCNLIRNYIDSEDEIIKYLEFCNEVGVDDVGLVSLMKVNDYCKNHHIDFNDFDFSQYKNIIRNRTWNNKDCCRCANYLYASSENTNIVKMYSRYYVKPHDVESQLVFDGQNLKTGFNGEIII